MYFRTNMLLFCTQLDLWTVLERPFQRFRFWVHFFQSFCSVCTLHVKVATHIHVKCWYGSYPYINISKICYDLILGQHLRVELYSSLIILSRGSFCHFTPNVQHEVGTWRYALITRTSTFRSFTLFIVFTLPLRISFSAYWHVTKLTETIRRLYIVFVDREVSWLDT
jgi:hypothetical protein